MALYKLPSAKSENRTATAFWMLLFSSLFTTIIFYDSLVTVNSTVLLIAAAWGLHFSLLSSLQMYALNHVDTNVLFPVVSTLSLVVSVLFGLTFFGEMLTTVQILGIVLAISTMYAFLYKKGSVQFSAQLLLVGLAILSLSAFGKIFHKFAVDTVPIDVLQPYQYVFAAFFAFILFLFYNHRVWKKELFSGAIKTGLMISVPSFLGGWAWLTALTMGPFSLVVSIHSMYVFVVALVGWVMFKETMTMKKVALLMFAVMAIILIKLG